MQKTTIYLDEETRLLLRRAAQREGKTQAELLRAAVLQYASRLRQPRARGIGAYRSGRSDVSEQAENLLRAAAKARKWR